MSLIINPYRFVAPPPPAGFDTSMLTGRTFVYDPTESLVLKGVTTTDGSPTTDGDPVKRIDSASGPGTVRTFALPSIGTSAFDWEVDEFGPGRHGMGGPLSVDYRFSLFNRPSAGAAPSASQAISTLFAAGNKTFIFAGRIDAAATDVGLPYSNNAILSDDAQYLGLHFYRSGSNAVLQWYSYDSSAKVVTATVPLGVPFVVACRHAGGSLGISVNNGAWTTAAASNTSLLTGQALALSGSVPSDSIVGAFVTCNANNSNVNIAACCTSAGALVGLTI